MAESPHGRWQERRALREYFQNGASVLMLAPRRIGKTWLLERVEQDMAAEGWSCIRIDVEGMRTEDEFLRALCREIESRQEIGSYVTNQIKQRFKQLTADLGKDGLVSAIGHINSREFLETLIASLDAGQRETLILIDEIALFVLELARRDVDATRALLYHLRNLKQEYKKVRWFLTGSIGLDVVARRHDMYGSMLGFDVFALEPFSEQAARSYVAEICATERRDRPFEFEPASFQYLVRELGWLAPYYLRQIALLIEPTAGTNESGRPLASVDDVAKVFQKLLAPSCRLHFSAWDEHIRKNFEKIETDRLTEILDVLCENSDGEIEATLLTRVNQANEGATQRQLKERLTNLANDGFIRKASNRWSFQSGLLRLYWLEYNKT